MEGKTVVAGRRFALLPRQGDFVFGDGVQENGEVFANRQIAQIEQLLRRCAHSHPVPVLHWQPQQSVPYRTTHHVNLHGGSLQIYGLAVCLCFNAVRLVHHDNVFFQQDCLKPKSMRPWSVSSNSHGRMNQKESLLLPM